MLEKWYRRSLVPSRVDQIRILAMLIRVGGFRSDYAAHSQPLPEALPQWFLSWSRQTTDDEMFGYVLVRGEDNDCYRYFSSLALLLGPH